MAVGGRTTALSRVPKISGPRQTVVRLGRSFARTQGLWSSASTPIGSCMRNSSTRGERVRLAVRQQLLKGADGCPCPRFGWRAHRRCRCYACGAAGCLEPARARRTRGRFEAPGHVCGTPNGSRRSGRRNTLQRRAKRSSFVFTQEGAIRNSRCKASMRRKRPHSRAGAYAHREAYDDGVSSRSKGFASLENDTRQKQESTFWSRGCY